MGGSWVHGLRDRLSAIVFDMDGVLLQSSAIHEGAFRQVLRPLRASFRYEDYAGLRTRESLIGILEANRISITAAELEDLAVRKTRLALEQIERENPIAPSAKDVLAHLSRRFPLGLATSASDGTVAAFLERNGLRRFFGSVCTGSTVSCAKPAPDIYLSVFRELQVPGSRTLVVEDAPAGIAAGNAAGGVTCGLPGTSSAQSLLDAGAHGVIQSLEDLLAL
jgi:HAD superfamily hydrolase (TIGR01509 family)